MQNCPPFTARTYLRILPVPRHLNRLLYSADSECIIKCELIKNALRILCYCNFPAKFVSSAQSIAHFMTNYETSIKKVLDDLQFCMLSGKWGTSTQIAFCICNALAWQFNWLGGWFYENFYFTFNIIIKILCLLLKSIPCCFVKFYIYTLGAIFPR